MRGPRWLILLLLLATPASSQILLFPSEETDPDRLRNLEYLLERIETLTSTTSIVTSGLDSSKVAKAGDTMTGNLNMSNAAINLSGAGGNIVGLASSSASGFFGTSAAFTYRVGIGSAVPTQPLVVIGTVAINGELLFQGTGAKGRLTSSPLAVSIGGIDMSWNGHSQASRDDAAVTGGHFRIADGGAFTWGSDVYDSMYYIPGADNYGHMSMGYGNSTPYFPATTVSGDFTLVMREGLLVGYNNSGNTKIGGSEGLAVEDDSGRSKLMLGYAGGSGRAWTMASNSAGSLTFVDSGQYGASNGGGTQMTISPAAGVAVATSATSGTSMCIAGAFQTLPTSGWAEGCFAYQLSDKTPYIATQTVVISQSWKALY